MPLYFLAILPPVDISQEVLNFQLEIETKFGAVHAQKAPPHITVIPPFECEVEKLDPFITKLEAYLIENEDRKIEIQLDGFQHFESRTLFVDVTKNEAFERFCKNLKQLFNQQKIIKQRQEKHFFVPHITLANKDIKKRDFKLAWDYFKDNNYQQSFELNAIVILQYDGKKWNIFKEIIITS